MSNVVVSGSVMTSTTNTPVNARARINTLSEVESIENPAIGEIFYCIENLTLYVITGLKSKEIYGTVLENATVDTYTEVCKGTSSGSSITVDTELSATSTNPVQNKVITAQVNTINSQIDSIGSRVDAVDSSVADKLDKLVSGTNIKTINGKTILGSGDITIEGGESIELDTSVTETSTNAVTSAGIYSAIVNKVDSKFVVLSLKDYTNMTSHDSKTFYFILK